MEITNEDKIKELKKDVEKLEKSIEITGNNIREATKQLEHLKSLKANMKENISNQCTHKYGDGSSALEFRQFFGNRCKICYYDEY